MTTRARWKKLTPGEQECWEAIERAGLAHLPWRKDWLKDRDGRWFRGGAHFRLACDREMIRVVFVPPMVAKYYVMAPNNEWANAGGFDQNSQAWRNFVERCAQTYGSAPG